MGQQGGILVKLKPAHGAVLLQILGYAGLINAQVFSKARPQRFTPVCAPLAPQQVPHAHSEGLAGLNVIVPGEVRIRENEYPWACGGLFTFFDTIERAGYQTAELRFQVRQARSQRWLARAAASLPGTEGRLVCSFPFQAGWWGCFRHMLLGQSG